MPEEKKEEEIILEEEIGDADAKFKKIKEKLEICRKEKTEYLVGWQRAQADFINYKRRQEEQLAEWSKIFSEGLMRDILPVLDTLDASILNNGDNGLAAIKSQLMKILAQHGLKEIKTIGGAFNPAEHEAVEAVEGDENESGIIKEEIQKGYLLNGKIIRAAKVKVNK